MSGNNDDELRRRRERNEQDEALIRRLREQHQREEAAKAEKLRKQNEAVWAAYDRGIQEAKKSGGKPPKKPKGQRPKGGLCLLILIGGLSGVTAAAATVGAVIHHFV